jgi:hypothetical protein
MAKLQFIITGGIYPNTARDRPSQRVRLPRLSDATVTFEMYNAADGPLDLTGGAVITNIRKLRYGSQTEGDIVFSRQATILNPPGAGRSSYDIIGLNDTKQLDPGRYTQDAWFIYPNGDEVRVIKPFAFILDQAITNPIGPVTVPASLTPLAQGPPGLYSFRYTFTGSEGTDFNVTMPALLQAAVGTDYDVVPTIVSADSYTAVICPIGTGDRTATQFRVQLGVALVAGSVIEFGVAPRVS